MYGYIRSFYDVLLMASFVPFLVYFMLSWRDHMRRSFLYLFSGSERQVVGKELGGRGRHGAGLRDREFYSGVDAGHHQ